MFSKHKAYANVRKYLDCSAEIYFLENGGNIVEFNDWLRNANYNESFIKYQSCALIDLFKQEIIMEKELSNSLICHGAILPSLPKDMKSCLAIPEIAKNNNISNSEFFDERLENTGRDVGSIDNQPNSSEVSGRICQTIDEEIETNNGTSNHKSQETEGESYWMKLKCEGQGTHKKFATSIQKRLFPKQLCSALNCQNSDLSKVMHRFPGVYKKVNNIKIVDQAKLYRCREWVRVSGNTNLLTEKPISLENKHYLCQDHFDCSQINSKDTKRLLKNVVPKNTSAEISKDLMDLYDCKWNVKSSLFGSVRELSDLVDSSSIKTINKNICDDSIDTSLVTAESEQLLDKNVSNSPLSKSQKISDETTEIVTEDATIIPLSNSMKTVDETDQTVSQRVRRRQCLNKKRCCASNCTSNENDILFKFPKLKSYEQEEIQRLEVWVKRAGNMDLLLVNPSQLNQKFYLCYKHFAKEDIRRSVSKYNLAKNSIPESFECDPLPDEELLWYMSNILPRADSLWNSNDRNDDDKFATNFENSMKKLKWFICNKCHEKHLTHSLSCVHKGNCDNFTKDNKMDPLNVPNELNDLTFVEEQLIARTHPMISVFKLKGLQYGYSGNVINFSQDVNSFAKQLPHKITELPSILTIKFNNAQSDSRMFHVRSEKVYNALVWLKEHNQFYKDIDINVENVNLLPEDGSVYDELKSVQFEINDKNEDVEGKEDVEKNQDVEEKEDVEMDSEDSSECNKLYESGVPSISIPNADAQVREKMFDWPEMSTTPINEYKTEGYIACAFPRLFPYGEADFRVNRKKKMDAADYFKHLLNYKDGRFAKHETFRFFAMNSCMRWNASKNGDVFIQNNSEFKDMTISKLKKLLEEKPHLIKKIMYQSSNLRGSRPYWTARCSELTDMVEQLGLPTFFLTLSCADHHWPQLFKILTGKDDISDLSEKKRRELIQQNPLIVDTFFHERVKVFVETVLKTKFRVKDYWYRIEYQHRGSPHMHGIFWVDGAIDVSNIENASEERLKEIAQYFDSMISAINPNPNCDTQGFHPCRQEYDEISKDILSRKEDLSKLLVSVQKHSKHSPDYCLRKNRKTGAIECRYHFPFEVREEGIIKKDDSGDYQYLPPRNDPYLNKFNEYIMQVWRANIDISPVLSKRALLHYLAKYISKCEVKSQSLIDLFHHIVEDFEDDDPVLKSLKRLYIRTCSERDFSAQEVCHIISGMNLYSSGKRNFVTVNMSNKRNWIKVQDDDKWKKIGRVTKSVIEKYTMRPLKFQDKSLWYMCKYHDPSRNWAKKKSFNIVQVFPKLKLKSNEEENEQYYRQKVLLHIPWNDEGTLIETGLSWKNLFDQNNVLNVLEEPIQLPPVNVDETEYEDDDDGECGEIENLEEFMVVSGLAPKKHVPEIELGSRQTDLDYDWSDVSEKYKQYGSILEFQNFVKNSKKNDVSYTHQVEIDDPSQVYSMEQQSVITQIENQIKFIKKELNDEQCPIVHRTIVQGKAGTGKSLVIKYITSRVSSEFDDSSCVLLLGPTGVSAVNINGQTVHKALHIPKQVDSFKSLSGESARQFCNKMEKIKFLIVDEYSMISCAMLRMIDLRCRQGTGKDEPFGGLFLYCFGDIRQLPPVKATALYARPGNAEFAIEGKAVVSTFEKCFFLTHCFRQEDSKFQNILDNLSTGISTLEDYATLSKRFQNDKSVTMEELREFDSALHLFDTKKKVFEHNYEKLQTLKHENSNCPLPVVKISGEHNCKTAKKGSSDVAGGLESVIYLARGCPVMLRQNLWTEKGLVNGSIGEVRDILYSENAVPSVDRPSVIMCKFPKYTGPGIGPDKLVPIPAISQSWTSNKVTCTRVQFPIVLCYACSIYKAQGLTLDKAVVDIGNAEFALGLTYVALSRVKTLNGLLLKSFEYERIDRLKNSEQYLARSKFEDFLRSIQ